MAESLEDIINDLADCCYIYGTNFDPSISVEENRKLFVAEAAERIRAAVAYETTESQESGEVTYIQV